MLSGTASASRTGSPLAFGRRLFFALLDSTVPSRCGACETPRRTVGGGGICDGCWRQLTAATLHSSCRVCALPDSAPVCADCRSEERPVSRTVASALYSGAATKIVVSYKFRGWDLLSGPLSRALSTTVREADVLAGLEAIVPVPSTDSRNRERGYDPASLLASETARRLGLPCRPALRRTRSTPPQSALPASERRANVRGAFRASRWARGKALLLVDDVLTTGATAFEAASALREAGAAEVRVAVFARTPEPEDCRLPEPT